MIDKGKMEKSKMEKIDELREKKKAQIISFHSYKSGVGKTTSLVQTAYLLGRKGKRVAIIDMDIDSPGLSEVFGQIKRMEGGFVKYIFNKYFNANKNNEKDKKMEMDSLAVRISYKMNGEVYLVGAGRADTEYVRMLFAIQENKISGNKYIIQLINDLTEVYNLDYVFIDTRCGINKWAGLSVAEISDEIIMFAYPDIENVKGINLMQELLKLENEVSLVFSKVDTSEAAGKEALKYLGKVNKKQNYISISYDQAIIMSPILPIEAKLNKYSALEQLISENAVKRKNEKWIEEHKGDVETLLDNLSSRKKFGKVLTPDEIRVLKNNNYAIVIDDGINLKDMIENSFQNKKVLNFKFYNKYMKKIVEKHCSSEEFLDVFCLSILSLALLSIDESLGVNRATDIENTLSKYFMDFYYKSSSTKGRIINASTYFGEILGSKESEEDKFICININELVEFVTFLESNCGVSKTKSSVLFRMLFLVFNVLNRNNKYQFKLILNDRKYKNNTDFVNEFKENTLDISWADLYKKQDIIDKVNDVLKLLFRIDIYSKVKTDLFFPMSVMEDGVNMKFDEWFVNSIKKRKLLSRKGILDIIQECAALEKKNSNKKSSILTKTKLNTAMERVSYR
ncbi:CobQ/CobB/MinD/ParA nucleotide binding domain-containing protein [Clostridium sp. DSM 8431]|uniref:KGGVGR-motif variant AAA ATPase n=1 Tax=Clostridium sp. DSM 8431 TaxID=1761781 RepID=UPI0008F17DAC|nr:AAA family ATPase [Clostridium sp. DSM 8431]SFU31978.1 CobQ/CobB/MinD/ParA nucleotide binding domain-containing protein [Clostridium sp. DSM 8431]